MLPQVIYLYPDNTQIVTVTGLQDVTTGDYLDAATVLATLIDQRGNLDPVFNNIVMGYLAGTNGNYQGTIPSTFSPKAFVGKPLSGFILQISAVQAGVQSLFSIPCIIQLRSQQ